MKEPTIGKDKFEEIKELMLMHEKRIRGMFGPGHNPEEAMRYMDMSKNLMQEKVCERIAMPVFEELVAAGIFEFTWEQIEEMKRVLLICELQQKAIEKDMEGRPREDIDAKNEEAEDEFKGRVLEIIQFECSEDQIQKMMFALWYFIH
jgi:hypothetical protein